MQTLSTNKRYNITLPVHFQCSVKVNNNYEYRRRLIKNIFSPRIDTKSTKTKGNSNENISYTNNYRRTSRSLGEKYANY